MTLHTPSDVLRITPGRLRTNPVWALNAFLHNASLEEKDFRRLKKKLWLWVSNREKEGFLYSQRAREHRLLRDFAWNSELPKQPRVVGLLVRRSLELATPLTTSRSHRGWIVQPNYLPFHSEQIQDALIKTLREAAFSLTHLVPELIGFSIQETLGELSTGDSMDVAGLLSVVDAMNGHSSSLLAKACAIVKPLGEKLVRVDSVEAKLNAFCREFGGASLLIAPEDFEVSDCLAACAPETVIWRVGSFRELAGKLTNAGLLDYFSETFVLDNFGLQEARNRLRWLTQNKGNAEALEFAERLERSVNQTDHTPLRISQAIEFELRELNRHVGRFAQAIKHSEAGVKKLEQMGDRISSFQEIVIAKTQWAASLFDGHIFKQAIGLLKPLATLISSDPSRVTAEVEIELRNTLGRLQMVDGESSPDEWESHFRHSLELQGDVDPDNKSRTACYLIRGLLRSSQLNQARSEIKKLSGAGLIGFGKTELKFLEADLARRQGVTWEDESFENDESICRGHPLGFYFQTTARQAGRSTEDSATRFEMAASEFRRDVGEFAEHNILELFSLFVLWRCELLKKNEDRGKCHVEEIQEFLSHSDTLSLKTYYSHLVEQASESGDFEPLFQAVPYF